MRFAGSDSPGTVPQRPTMDTPTQFTRAGVLFLVAAVAVAGLSGSAVAGGADECTVDDSVQDQAQDLTQADGEIQAGESNDQTQSQYSEQRQSENQCGDNSLQAQAQDVDQTEAQFQAGENSDQFQSQAAVQDQSQEQNADNSTQLQTQTIDQTQIQVQIANNSTQSQSQTAAQQQSQQQGDA